MLASPVMEWAGICVSWYDALQETQCHLSGDAVKNAKSEFNHEEHQINLNWKTAYKIIGLYSSRCQGHEKSKKDNNCSRLKEIKDRKMQYEILDRFLKKYFSITV